ncbi:MAG: SpoIIE family protein phosphatase [Cyanobacteria bacterium P01_H01_bin.121]
MPEPLPESLNSPAKIVVVDDDPAIQLVLKRSLEHQGHEVSVASDGEAGLAQIRAVAPDLVICDWMMPKVSGLEVCATIKSDSDLSTIFFILLTSRTSIEDRVLGLDTGADDFLSKPIEIVELQARVRAGLRVQRLNRALQLQTQLLNSELAEASDYVKSLLPDSLTTPLPIEASFLPSSQLGGDCYDYAWLDPDHLAVFLLDMSGHGLGAALPSVSLLNMLRSQSLSGVDFKQPDQVLAALNRVFQMSNQSDRYFTIWYGIYNRSTRKLKFSSAGHPPALLLSPALDRITSEPIALAKTAPDTIPPDDITIEFLKTTGFPIGMFADARFVCQEQEIPATSTLYIFSDGIYEIPQIDGKLWGLQNWIQLLSQLHREGDVTIGRIIEQLKVINQDDTFKDDVSLIKVDF